MHSLSSTKEMLLSLPIDVEFAGFRTNTLVMGKAGWDLSMEQITEFAAYEKTFQLVARHGDRNHALYLMSQRIRIPHREMQRYMSSPIEYAKFFSEHTFHIQYAANDMHIVAPMRGQSSPFSASFNGFDPIPQERMMKESIKDFPFFKVAKEQPTELIVDPSRVPELLDLILKSQEQQQAEIRERNRRRERIAHYDGEIKSAGNVCAQIITLAG